MAAREWESLRASHRKAASWWGYKVEAQIFIGGTKEGENLSTTLSSVSFGRGVNFFVRIQRNILLSRKNVAGLQIYCIFGYRLEEYVVLLVESVIFK